MHTLTINPQRFLDDFEALSQIGATPGGGVHRPALSVEHLAARTWLRLQIEKAGLEFYKDGAGNQFARLACAPRGAPSLLLGSHLDSVPNGGRFDGPLGVLAGLEVLRRVKELGLALPVNLELVDFTDEEGTWISLLGSHAHTGQLSGAELEHPHLSAQEFEEALQRAGLTRQGILSARREPGSLAGYLELHIEQGKRLEQRGLQIGIVTGITGIAIYRLHFLGRADHAGTCEMPDRLDASQGAAAFILEARRLVMARYPECTANIGQAHFSPGAFNIVPEQASLAFECRSADSGEFARLQTDLLEAANREAQRYGLRLEVEALGEHPPVQMDARLRAGIAGSAAALGLAYTDLSSRAGHDAQALAAICPAAMLFVPSQAGASHAPREFSSPQDCINGANVLLNAAISWI